MARGKPPVHRGYEGSCILSARTGVFYGHVTNVRHVMIPFRVTRIRDYKAALSAAVEAYLSDCRFGGLTPDKPIAARSASSK